MAVRAIGVGEVPDTFSYPDADDIDIIEGDFLRVLDNDNVVAVFHRDHWSRAEILPAEAVKS